MLNENEIEKERKSAELEASELEKNNGMGKISKGGPAAGSSFQ